MKNPVYRNLFVLSFGVFAILNTELGIVGIIPELARATGRDIAQMGYLIGAFAMTVTFVGPIFSVFAMRFMERKFALLFSQSLLALTNVLFITVASYPILFLARIIGGLGHPLFFTLALGYSSRALPEESRGKGTAILFSGVNVAMILGFPIISLLTSAFSYRVGIGFSLLSNIVALVGITLFIPKSTPEERQAPPMKFSAFRDKGFVLGIPVVTALFAGTFVMYSYFAPYLKTIWSFSPQTLAMALLCFGIFGFIGNIVAGFVPAKKTGFALCLFVVLILAIFMLLSSHILFVPVLVLISAWGFLQSGVTLLGQVWFTLNKIAPPEAVNSLVVSGFNFGITLGSSIGGIALKNFGISVLPVVGSVILLLVLVGIFWDQRTFSKKLEMSVLK